MLECCNTLLRTSAIIILCAIAHKRKIVAEDSFKSHIAKHIKALRQHKGLSLDATAKATGVSKAMLGQIEREESSPTIATLRKIASGLDTSFSAFFAAEAKLHEHEWAFPDDAQMKVRTLFEFQTDTGMEMFEITLLGAHSQQSSPHSVGVIEHVHVLQGQMRVFFDDQWHDVNQGECLRFYADQPHVYAAMADKVVFQNIICYPK